MTPCVELQPKFSVLFFGPGEKEGRLCGGYNILLYKPRLTWCRVWSYSTRRLSESVCIAISIKD